MTTCVNELSEEVVDPGRVENIAETEHPRLTSLDSEQHPKGRATLVSELTMVSTLERQ